MASLLNGAFPALPRVAVTSREEAMFRRATTATIRMGWPKPGSGIYIHQSVVVSRHGKNLFSTANGRDSAKFAK